MVVHEFVCDDCKSDVFSFGGPDVTVCQSCLTIREMKARDPMTPAQEAALREILGNVIPIKAAVVAVCAACGAKQERRLIICERCSKPLVFPEAAK